MSKNRFSRRDFMKLTGVSAASLAVSGSLARVTRAFAQSPTTITFTGWGGTEEDQGVQDAVKQFQSEQSAVQVKWQQIPDVPQGTYTQTFLTNLAAGTPPDTAFIMSDVYQSFAQQGVLLDITDRLMADPLLSKPDYFIEPQEKNRSTDAKGRWHGIGSTWVAPHIYYNGDVLAKAKVTPPGFKDNEIWDWNTFLANAKQLTVDTNGRHPDDSGFDKDNVQTWGVQWPMWWVPLISAVYANGGEYFDKGGFVVKLDAPEAMDAMQKLADLIFVHHVSPDAAAMSSLGMTNTQMLESGRLAMAIDGSWALSYNYKIKAPLGTGALPKLKQAASLMQAHFHGVMAATKNPDAAWQWLRFLNTPFYQTHFCKIGLWVPSQTAMLTPDGLKTWITKGIHPDNYVDFVSTYLPKYGVVPNFPPGYLEASTKYLYPAMTDIGNGTPLEKAIPPAVKSANEVLAKAASA
ncbi:MAG: extracellular solute-binding protein [Aggregatilineales bacterium]